jgi:hypothetical protein
MAEGFFCSLDVLYGGDPNNFFSGGNFFQIFGHQNNPGSGSVPVQPKMLDPDPYKMK